MGEWAVASWWAGGALALGALVVIALALFRDRSRGRRRCPKCWYDMSGVPSPPAGGMTCPECGRAQAKESRFFRTRRSWRRVLAGAAMLFVAAGIAVGPAVYTGKWTQYTPVSVLRLALSFFKGSADAVDQKTLNAGTMANLSTWERLLLASDMSRDLRWWLDASAVQRQEAYNADRNARITVTQQGIVARTTVQRTRETRRGLFEMQMNLPALGAEARLLIPELIDALRSTDESISGFAAGALEALGKSAAANRPAIRRILAEGPSVQGRLSTLRLLVATDLGDERTMAAIRAAARKDKHENVRHAATMVMAVKEPAAPATMDALLDDLARGGEPVQVLRTLGWYADSEAGRRPGVDGWWWSVRIVPNGAIPNGIQAPAAPPEQEDPRVIPAIASALKHQDVMVRHEAATMLGGIGARIVEVAGELRERILVETDETARRAMITAYVKAEGAEVGFLLPELMQEVRGEDDEHRRWAAWTLAGCGERAAIVAPDLRRGALEDAEDRQGIYCDALGFIGADGWRALNELVHSGAPARLPAARALGMSGTRHPQAAAYLLTALRDADSEVRVAAALGLHFCDGNEEVIKALAEMVGRDEDWEARHSALISLAGVGDIDTVVATCIAAIKDRDERVRELALLTLREKMEEDEAARQALEKATRDDDVDIRKAARDLLDGK